MNKQALKEQACNYIDEHAALLRETSLFLHSHPEIGGQERLAATRLTDILRQRGFTVKENISGYPTAFTAVKGSSEPRIAFLAEYDALPMLGHACGHNLIAAMSLGAALAFSAAARDCGTSCLIGCPAEETSGAKAALAADGVFQGLTAAFIIHPAAENTIGGTSLATHPLEVVFHGRTAHVANPTAGCNALDALIEFYCKTKALSATLTARHIIAGIITEGGTAPNIIPDKATAHFTVRAADTAYLEGTILPSLRRLAADTAQKTGTAVTLRHYEPLYMELINNPQLMVLFSHNMTLLGEKITRLPDDDAAGSTDVGNVSHCVPTVHPEIAIGSGISAHTPEFAAAACSDYAHQQLLIGAKAMAMSAIDLLP